MVISASSVKGHLPFHCTVHCSVLVLLGNRKCSRMTSFRLLLCALVATCLRIHVVFSCSSLSAHSPDNSFLGFAVDVDMQEGEKWDKLNQAVVYGKELYMWKVCAIMHTRRVVRLASPTSAPLAGERLRVICIVQPQLTATPHSHTSQPHLTATPHNHTSRPHLTATPHNHTSQPQLTATAHGHTSRPHLTATPQPHLTATAHSHTSATPHSHTSQPHLTNLCYL